MATAERRYQRARRRAQTTLTDVAREIRDARLMAGTSQAAVAKAARISRSNVSRIEAGKMAHLSIAEAVILADAVGLDLSVKAYPGRSPTRDAGHATKLLDFLAHVAQPLRFSLEVALPAREDVIEQRAWDAMIFSPEGDIGIELEMRLYDLQAQARRILLKWRDGGSDRLLLLIANTASNRAVLRLYPEYLVDLPRLSKATVLTQIGKGERPPSGHVLI